MIGGPRAGAASAAALVVAIWLAALAPVLVGGQSFAGPVHGAQTAVWHQQAGDALARGNLPEWDDRSGLGAALAGAPDRPVLYPPVWLTSLGGDVFAVDVLIAAHLLLFGLGVAAWTRRLAAHWLAAATTGGAAITLAGLMEIVIAGGFVYAACWLPWIGWAADRLSEAASRRHRQRGWLHSRIAAVVVLAAVSGAALLSGPTGAASAAAAVAIAAIVARAPLHLPSWMLSITAAVLGLALAAIAWLPAWSSGSMQLDSMAGAGQLLMSDAALVLAVFALLPGRRVGPLFRLVCVAVVCAAIGAVWMTWREPMWLAARTIGWMCAGVGLSRLLAGLVANGVVVAAVAVVAALAIPVLRLWVGPDTQSRARLRQPPEALAQVASGSDRLIARLAWPRIPDPVYQDGPPLSGARFGLGYVPGGQGDAELTAMWRRSSGAAERFLDLFGVELVMVPASVATPAALPVLGRTHDGTWVVARNQSHRPRAFVAQDWSWHDSAEQLERDMFPTAPDQLPSLALGRVRLIGEGPKPARHDGPVPAPRCRLVADRVEEIALDCDSSRGGYAVLLDRHAPGWTATVDGRAAAIERADGLVRAVAIDPGPHRIVFRYRTPGLLTACMVSALTALGLLLLGLFAGRVRAKG